MSFILRTFLIKQLGLDEVVDDVVKDMFGESPEVLKLLMPKRYAPMDLTQELINLAKQFGIEVKEAKGEIDEVRRAAAIAANVTPLNVENPAEVLWQIAMKMIKGGNSKTS